MATWADVRRHAMALPGVTEERGGQLGLRSWIVNKKGFVWERPLRKNDLAALGDGAPTGPILGVRTADLEMKDVLLKSNPGVFFTTPHFDGYPAVLVQLNNIDLKTLKDIIVEAWVSLAQKKAVEQYLRGLKR